MDDSQTVLWPHHDSRAEIDRLCDEFESQWQQHLAAPDSHQRPAIEDYLTCRDELERETLFRELLGLDVDYRRQLNETPQERNYQGFAELTSVVRDVLASAYETETEMPSTEPQRSDTSQPKFGKFKVMGRLGAGSQGTTFVAFDPDLRRRVVIKQYLSAGTAVEQQAVLNEGRALASVESRYVAQCLNIERIDDQVYLLMEYIRGSSLSQECTSLDMMESAKLVAHLAEGLSDVHARRLLHRDIKPSNIIVRDNRLPCLVDFGLAASMTDESLGRLAGTFAYMAPEQARCDTEQIGPCSDIFGLGAVLYKLLTGRAPFEGVKREQIWSRAKKGDFPNPRSINPRIPIPLEDICLQSMSVDPANRYRSADALGRSLRRYLRSAMGEANLDDAQIGPNPYKGLSSFTEDDAHLFFGRDEQIERLWEAFRQLHTQVAAEEGRPRILPILGPSGSGKSSLARAGLLAELMTRPLPTRERVRFAVVTPGLKPLQSLATALGALTEDPVEKAREFETQLTTACEAGRFDGLRRIMETIEDSDVEPVVLLVDQFEELYSLCEDEHQRRAFIEGLLDAASDPSGRLSVTLTLRSDFLSATQDDQQINVVISEQGILVPAMTEAELRRAIAEPAARSGHPLDHAIVELAVNEARDREGALPLLQFTLSRVWEGLRAGTQPADTWKRIGGIGGALAGEAERIYAAIPPEDQPIARRAFLSMVQLGEGTRDTRRRTQLNTIAISGEDSQRVHDVISRFASQEARLISLSASETESPTAEITHEALLGHWPRLSQWLDEGRDDLRFSRRVDEASSYWNQEGQPEGLLWRSPDLDYLRQYHQRCAKEMTPTQTEFFEASTHREDSEKRRAKRTLRIYQGSALAIAILACVAALFGFRSARDAKQARFALGLSGDHLVVLARAAQDGLSSIPDERARVVTNSVLKTVANGIDDIENAMEPGPLKSMLSAARHRYRGDVFMDEGEFQEALNKYRESLGDLLPTRDAPKYRDGDEWQPLYNLARIEDCLGEAHKGLKQYGVALKHFENAQRYREEWLASGVKLELALSGLEKSADKQGSLFKHEGRHRLALQKFKESLAMRRRQLKSHPASVDYRMKVGGGLWAVGAQLAALGQYPQAIEHLEESLSVMTRVQKEQPGDLRLAANIGLFETELGRVFELQDETDKAASLYDKAVLRLGEYFAQKKSFRVRKLYWRALYRRGTARLANEPDAASAFAEALNVVPPNTSHHIWTLARDHQVQAAAEMAEKLSPEYAAKPQDLYEVGCGFALCVWSIQRQNAGNLDEEQQQQVVHLSARAIEMLRQAVDAGYNSLGELRDSPELDAIRGEDAFVTLLSEVERRDATFASVDAHDPSN